MVILTEEEEETKQLIANKYAPRIRSIESRLNHGDAHFLLNPWSGISYEHGVGFVYLGEKINLLGAAKVYSEKIPRFNDNLASAMNILVFDFEASVKSYLSRGKDSCNVR